MAGLRSTVTVGASWAYVIAALTALATDFETHAMGFKTHHVAKRDLGSGPFCDPVAQLQEVVSRFRREPDSSALQRRALRLAYRARASANTDFAGSPRVGLVFMAS